MHKPVVEPSAASIPLTSSQKRAFWAAWGGWTMDGMDSFIFSLVLVPALRDVLPRSGIPATTANVGYYSGLLFALFMVHWRIAGVGGMARKAAYLGRVFDAHRLLHRLRNRRRGELFHRQPIRLEI